MWTKKSPIEIAGAFLPVNPFGAESGGWLLL